MKEAKKEKAFNVTFLIKKKKKNNHHATRQLDKRITQRDKVNPK